MGPDPVDHCASVARSVNPAMRFLDPNTSGVINKELSPSCDSDPSVGR